MQYESGFVFALRLPSCVVAEKGLDNRVGFGLFRKNFTVKVNLLKQSIVYLRFMSLMFIAYL